MTKAAIFKTIKDANAIVDQMAGLSVDSKEYDDLNEALGATLDCFIVDKYRNYNVHMSKRTGHYYVRFWD